MDKSKRKRLMQGFTAGKPVQENQAHSNWFFHKDLLEVLRALKLHRVSMKHLLDAALDIALDNTLAVYDAAYIALALHFICPLITLDHSQSHAAIHEGAIVKPLTDFK